MEGGIEKTGAPPSPQVTVSEKSGGYIGSVFKISGPLHVIYRVRVDRSPKKSSALHSPT